MKAKITKLLIPVIVGSFCFAGAWALEAQAASPAEAAGQGQDSGMMASGGGMMGREDMRMRGSRGMDRPRMGRDHFGRDGWGDRRGMWHRGMGHRGMHWSIGPRGRLMALVCSDRGAEALEVALVRLSYRLKITDQQRPLFDDLKDTAVAEQQKFAQVCRAALPRRQAGQRPDPLELFRNHITVEEAKLAAMQAVLPKIEALYKSLSDDQKRLLLPRGIRNAGPGANQNRPGGQTPAPRAEPNAPGGNGGNMAPAPGNNGGGGQNGGNNGQGGSNPPPASVPNSI